MNSNPSKKDELKTSDFDFQVPDSLVAQQPLSREESKLIIRKADGSIAHSKVEDLAAEIPADSLLILNNSKVIASRLFGHLPTGGKVETFLLEAIESGETSSTWTAIARPLRKLKVGARVSYDDGVTAEVTRNDGELHLHFDKSEADTVKWLERFGIIPLPPYIRRDNPVRADLSPDRETYQTVYAAIDGSVAAPTAGLHFSTRLLDELKGKGVEIKYVTLHVGAGTFLPVHSDEPAEHVMHEERYLISADTLDAIETAQTKGRKIIGVGTTTLRCLEAIHKKAKESGIDLKQLADKLLRTDLYIRPTTKADRHSPWCLDALMTNFHQPKSTLFMLICALVGFDETKALYKKAIDDKYRLFSYGDSSLFWLK